MFWPGGGGGCQIPLFSFVGFPYPGLGVLISWLGLPLGWLGYPPSPAGFGTGCWAQPVTGQGGTRGVGPLLLHHGIASQRINDRGPPATRLDRNTDRNYLPLSGMSLALDR